MTRSDRQPQRSQPFCLLSHPLDFLDGDENGIPDDTNGDGLISYGTGSSPDYSVADIWIGDKKRIDQNKDFFEQVWEMQPTQ
jgi:spore coat protein A